MQNSLNRTLHSRFRLGMGADSRLSKGEPSVISARYTTAA